MTIDFDILRKLLTENPSSLQSIPQEDIDALSQTQIQTLEKAISNMRLVLYAEGIRATAFYHAKAKDVAFTKEETKILPRVRLDARYATPSFMWEKLIRKTFPISENEAQNFRKKPGTYIGFVRRGKSRIRMKVVLSGKVVPIQKATDSIAPSTFNKEPTWAQIAGEDSEAKLRSLRKQSKQVTAMAKHLNFLKQQQKKRGELICFHSFHKT